MMMVVVAMRLAVSRIQLMRSSRDRAAVGARVKSPGERWAAAALSVAR